MNPTVRGAPAVQRRRLLLVLVSSQLALLTVLVLSNLLPSPFCYAAHHILHLLDDRWLLKTCSAGLTRHALYIYAVGMSRHFSEREGICLGTAATGMTSTPTNEKKGQP